jgi:hypothetical protein
MGCAIQYPPAVAVRASYRLLATRRPPGYGTGVQVEVSSAAAEFVLARGGRLWVWFVRPRRCCSGTPALMHAATEPPAGLTGFAPVAAAPLQIWFRAPGERRPDVLEIGLAGRRRARVEAYWDGCLMAM